MELDYDYLHDCVDAAMAEAELREDAGWPSNSAGIDWEAEWEAERQSDADRLDAELKVEAYAAQWPGVCRQCHGYGYIESHYDPSAPGVSLAPGEMVDLEPCDACVCEGHCPRCGAPWPDDVDAETDNVGPCASCGFVLYETEGVLYPVRI